MHRSHHKTAKHICILINVDWFALSHFSDYLREIISRGHKVTILTTDTGKKNELICLGAEVLYIDLSRGYENMFAEIRSCIRIYEALAKLNPDVLELVTIKPIIYGGLCSRLLRIKSVVYYMSGLGVIFSSRGFFSSVKSRITTLIYRYLMRSEGAQIIVENTDDLEVFKRHVADNLTIITVIPGVGVDVNAFRPYDKKSSATVKVAMVSRILHDKGVDEFRVSAIALKNKYPNVEFILAGTIDPTNPASYSTRELDEIVNEGVINLLGHVENVACFLRSIDIFLLPSYREGFPRAIMEASASGLPVITTDVVGCRSAIVHNETGILIKSRDEQGLIDATEKLILSSELRVSMGKNGRNHAERKFDEKMLSAAHVDTWEL